MMDGEDLMTVSRAHLDTGLRGIPVGTCRTSFVTPEDGVHYVGYPIEDLVDLDPMDVIHLLFEKDLPDPEQSYAFRRNLLSRSTPTEALAQVIECLPSDAHPMDVLAVGMQTMGMGRASGHWKEDALDLVAGMPALIALILRAHEGRTGPVPIPDHDQGLVERFIHMYDPPGDVDRRVMARIVRAFLVLHMDHGGGNLSTFTGKAVASGHATVYASMVAAMNALSGPRHGRANQSCLEFVQRIGTDDPVQVEAFIRGELQAGRPIYGFGHAVLREEDPRARLQFQIGSELCPDDPNFRIVTTLREVAPRVLSEIEKISNPHANVDIASGTLLHYAGFHDASTYTLFFGWARVAGIGAQLVDEATVFRDGKGVAIYRPKYIADQQSLRRIADQ